MMLGYASGGGPVAEGSLLSGPWADTAPVFAGIEPFAEIAGLEAELVGSLAHFQERLHYWWAELARPATPERWAERGRALLADFFSATDDADRALLGALDDALSTWMEAWSLAGGATQADSALATDGPLAPSQAPPHELPLAVARQAWLDALNEPKLTQRFRAGGVTFCTLMPMRAIPFEVVCLLGMNDGDYPRRAPRSDFDLMGQPGQARPGDRSRRHDDRQLMLEALLSARRCFYVSWTGRSVRDNTTQPPSVLVSQLRDYLAAGWSPEVVTQRTQEHPLQPFSRRYFEPGSGLFTYAREWRTAHAAPAEGAPGVAPAHSQGRSVVAAAAVPVTLDALAAFLRNPVKAYCRDVLAVVFDDEANEVMDDEAFTLRGLEDHAAMDELLQIGVQTLAAECPHPAPEAVRAMAQAAVARLRRTGRLPLGALGDLTQTHMADTLAVVLQAWQCQQQCHPLPAPHVPLQLAHAGVQLQDGLDGLRALPDGGAVWISLRAGKLTNTVKPGTQSSAKSRKAKPPAEPRLAALLPAWLRALASAACGQPVSVLVVGRDAVVWGDPPPPEEALATLQGLLTGWATGHTRPLPVPQRTALAWLTQPESAQAAYEGSYQMEGEGQEPCLARFYPDFAALVADGQLQTWAPVLAAPLQAWAQTCLTITLHGDDAEHDSAQDDDAP
jgi:exodeoxyribonuclease V gamma subunit